MVSFLERRRNVPFWFIFEQEVELSHLAAVEGKAQEQLAREVLGEGLAAKAQFISAVRAGQEAARRGDFVEQAVVWADVEAILNA